MVDNKDNKTCYVCEKHTYIKECVVCCEHICDDCESTDWEVCIVCYNREDYRD
jgi:hypothetical protein